jgi:hypothetical protein
MDVRDSSSKERTRYVEDTLRASAGNSDLLPERTRGSVRKSKGKSSQGQSDTWQQRDQEIDVLVSKQ